MWRLDHRPEVKPGSSLIKASFRTGSCGAFLFPKSDPQPSLSHMIRVLVSEEKGGTFLYAVFHTSSPLIIQKDSGYNDCTVKHAEAGDEGGSGLIFMCEVEPRLTGRGSGGSIRSRV